MSELIRAKEPFMFYTRLNLSELTGLRASNLNQLLSIIKEASDSCVYYHTHRFLQQHQYLSPEPPNDFAYWVTSVLGEDELGEKLASIDTVQFSDIGGLREKITTTIESYLKDNILAKLKFSREGAEFYFIKSVSFILPTKHIVYDLKEFMDVIRDINIDSIYFHIFEARLRINKKSNDFSYWIETSIGDKGLSDEISKLDTYTYTLEDLRQALVDILEKRLTN